MVQYGGWFVVDGEELDGTKEVSQGDVTEAVNISKSRTASNSIYASIDDLAGGTAEIKIEVLVPDGDVEDEEDWLEYKTEYPFEIDTEDVAVPLLFQSDARFIRLKFETLPTDTTCKVFIFRTA